LFLDVIPAKAGIQLHLPRLPPQSWIPAFAGMTVERGVIETTQAFQAKELTS
jgi:hypothetical protein